LGTRIGRVKPTDDYYSEAVKKFEREYQEYVAEVDGRYQWPRKPGREPQPILARLVQYGLIAAFMSVVIVGLLSLRVH
jgi:hypothetical protein